MIFGRLAAIFARLSSSFKAFRKVFLLFLSLQCFSQGWAAREGRCLLVAACDGELKPLQLLSEAVSSRCKSMKSN